MPRAAVTVCVLSRGDDVAESVLFLDHRLVAKATPAVAVADGCGVMTSWLAAAGLTTKLLDVALVNVLSVAVSV